MGGKAIIARSFARIAETNLKKQGVLALTFVNSTDFDRVQEDDRVAVKGLDGLAPGKTVKLELSHADGSSHSFEVKHSLTAEQIEWFKAGSALNRIADQQKS